jgi:hypothetical protein
MKYALSLIIVSILLQACNPEYRIARKFVASPGKLTVLVIPPTFLYKNKKHPLDTVGLAGLDETARDSAIYERSTYLKWVVDTTFLRIFTNSFLNELRKYGVKVHFRESPDPKEVIDWTLDFVQAQLEEEQQILGTARNAGVLQTFGRRIDSTLYYRRLLNEVTSNTWLKVYFNAGRFVDSATLFHTNTITDHVESGFTLAAYQGRPILIPKQRLRQADIYPLARMEGKIQAILFFDLMLNTYIYDNSKLFYYEYLDYNRETKRFSVVTDKRFEIIR